MSLSYHGFLGATEAEDIIRMSGAERGYLTRQSVVKPGFYILSFQEGGKILHHIAYNDISNRDHHEKRSHGETFAKRRKIQFHEGP